MADVTYTTEQRTDGAGNPYSVRIANDSNVISSASLQPKSPITPVTPTPDSTNYSGITGGITQSIMDAYKTYNTQQQTTQANQQSTGQSILDYMKQLQGKTADTQAANDATGVTTETANLNKYTQQLADLNAQASSLNREAQSIPIQTQERNRNTGATDAGVASQDAGALRLNALKALSIGQQSDIAYAAATGSQLRLQAAKDKAQQIIDLKYKPIEDEIDLKKKQYDLNKDALASIDAKRTEALGVALDKEKQDLADKKAKQKANADLALQAGVKTKFMNKGGEISQASDGTAFSSPVDFLKAAGISISDKPTPQEIQAGFAQAYQKGLITDISGETLSNINFVEQARKNYPDANIPFNATPEQVAQAIKQSAIYKKDTNIPGNYEMRDDGSIFNKNTGQLIQTVSQDSPLTDGSALAIKDSFNAIAARLSKDGRSSAQTVLNQYLQRGDMEGAKQFVISTAISSLPAEQQNKAFGRLTAIDALKDIQTALSDYSTAGGNTGILSGNYEKIIQKLGETSDPKLADIANRISLSMIAYRNAVSGAAFTESEAKQYESIFPSVKGNTELNNAKIGSLLHVFDLNQKSTLSTVLGQRNYDDLQPSSTAGKIIEYEGRSYNVAPNGDMTPIGTGSPLDFNKAMGSGGLSYTPVQKQNLSYAPNVNIPKVTIGAGAAVKNNNPGNLRNVDGSWQKFSTPEEGFKGLMGYLARAVSGNHTAYNGNNSLYQFFSKYAPAADSNNPKSYAENVAKRLGVSPSTKISQLDLFAWAKEIARHESNTSLG